MVSRYIHPHAPTAKIERAAEEGGRYLVLVGRVLFAIIFVTSLFTHFQGATIDAAAAHGVPIPGLLVPLAGVIAFLGGLSIAFGYYARIGAVLLLVFLVPVTMAMHDFWNVHEAMARQVQLIMFMKNVTMIGAVLMIMYFGAGPLSADERLGH